MEVTIISHGLKFGGAQESTLDIIKHLDNLEIKVNLVICTEANKEYLKRLKKLNANISYVKCSFVNNYPFIEKFSYSSIKLLRSSDIIWINDVLYLSAPILKKIAKRPIVAHLRSYALLCPKWNLLRDLSDVCYNRCSIINLVKCRASNRIALWRISRLYGVKIKRANPLFLSLDPFKGFYDYIKWPIRNKEIIQNIDGFIAVSNFVKEIHESLNPCFREKDLVTIYNPIDVCLDGEHTSYGNSFDRDEMIIVYASGESLAKGPHISILAINKLIKKGSKNLKLYMFGIKKSQILRAMIKKHNLNHYVKLVPRVSRNLLHRFIRHRAHLVIMPSIWPEPFGRIPVEANKLGVPVIVSNRGGLPETIEKDTTGYIVPPTPDSLAKAIINAMNKDWNSQNIAEIARKRFDSRRSTLLLLDFFYKMLQ